MDKSLVELLSSLRASQDTMVAQLHQFCEINSGTENLTGLMVMHDTLQNAFAPIADAIASSNLPPVPTIDMSGNTILQTYGNLLYIRKRPDLKRRVLLSGHMDTVYSANHPFQSLKYINDNCINGPGVADMKGGLIVMLHALTAFEATPYADELGWDVLINADEEIGSPASGAFLAEIAPNYQTALVYEPAMTAEGTLAKNRRGSGKLSLIATGKSAHVGRAFDQGRNAICFLAEAITAIHALNNKRDGVTINVGLIAGGDALNVVPDKAVAKLDIRINQPEDESWVRKEIDTIIAKLMRKDYTLTVHGHFGRPVKRVDAATQQLFSRVQRIGERLGLRIDWQDSGGCCDGNNLAQHGLPVLDTLGVRGGNIHSANEFILLDSLVERAALSALLLVELAREGMSI
jgi:glutamate carboxypeptidase